MEESKKISVRKIVKLGLIAAIVISCIILVWQVTNFKQRQKVTSTMLEENLVQISELSTVKQHYKSVATFKETKEWNELTLPFTTKKFLIIYSGYIKAGIDASEVKVDIADEDRITVTLPHAAIMDNVINEDEIEVYDESNSLFNKLNYTDLLKVLNDEKKSNTQDFIDKGLLKEAEKNAKNLFQNYLKDLGFKNITIEFKGNTNEAN